MSPTPTKGEAPSDDPRVRYPVQSGRFLPYALTNWLVIFACAWLTPRLGWWSYPFAALVIANRLLATFLLTHEGVHGNLMRSRKWNDRLTRYLLSFPIYISLTKYRRVHRFHHQRVGVREDDPDYPLYAFFPLAPWRFAIGILWATVSLRLPRAGLAYFNEMAEFWEGKRTLDGRRFVFSMQSDWLEYVLFQVAIWSLAIGTGHLRDYALFLLMPLFCLLLPYGLLIDGLQHGPAGGGPNGQVSRSLTGPRWLMEIVMPCRAEFHAEHHGESRVPYYWLERYARDLEREGQTTIWRETYAQSLRRLFTSVRHVNEGTGIRDAQKRAQ